MAREEERQPCILYILILPFLIVKYLLYLTGMLTYLPIYSSCYIFKKFVFSPDFETSQSFYIIFCIPRALLSLLGFVVGAGELYFIYWIISEFIPFETTAPLVITLVSVLCFVAVSFRFGYKGLIIKLKFPKMKAVQHYLIFVWYGIQDLLSGIFTILVLIMLFRAKVVFHYKFAPNERKYLAFSFRLLRLSIFDVFCSIFWIILWFVPWRFIHTRRRLAKAKSEENRQFIIMKQSFYAIFDIIFMPFFLVALCNPFFKGIRLLSHMSQLSVTTWRRIVFQEFISTVLDIIPFCCLILSFINPFSFLLILNLYAYTIKTTKPFEFPNDQEFIEKAHDNEYQKDLSLKVYAHTRSCDKQSRHLYGYLMIVSFQDLLIFISKILLFVSIYRQIMFNKKMKKRKARAQSQAAESRINYALTYTEYRAYLYKFFVGERSNKHPVLTTYPGWVICEASHFLLDLPIIMISPILLLVPWRIRKVCEVLHLRWKMLKDPEQALHVNIPVRSFVFCRICRGILDYFVCVFFLVCLMAVWRWKYLFPEIKKIIKFDRKTFKRVEDLYHYSKLDVFVVLILKTFWNVQLDFILAPLIALLAPFYLICFWRIRLLVKCLRLYEPKKFMTHRLLVLRIGYIAFIDFLDICMTLIVFATLIRIKMLLDLMHLDRKERVAKSMAEVDKKETRFEVGITIHSNPQSPEKDLVPPNDDDLPPELVDQPPKKKEEPPNKVEKKPEEYLTASEIIKNERHIVLFDAARKCCRLLFFDLPSIPFFILIFTKPAVIYWYRDHTRQINKDIKTVTTMGAYYKLKKKKVAIKFEGGFYAIVSHLVTLGLILLVAISAWRLPTIITFIANKRLREALLEDIIRNEKKRKEVLEDDSKRLIEIILFCSLQQILDLLYLPLFISLVVLSPWRICYGLKGIYRYDPKVSPVYQIDEQRAILKRQAILGLGDIMNVVKLIIILVTLIRVPFLVLMILRNRFPNSKLTRKLFKVPTTTTTNQNDKKKLSIKKCIRISFKELLKDLPLIPFALFLLVLAPWRIFSVYYIVKSQVDRIPTYDIERKKRKVPSRRTEILSLIWVVLRVDIPYFIRIIFMMLSIIRIPIIVKMVIHYLRNVEKYQRGDLSFIKGIDIEAEKAANSRKKMLSALVIVLFMWRLPRAIQRYKAYNKTKKEKMRQMRYKQHEFDVKTKERFLSLNDITWDTYGKICQFLSIQDLARLSQVNKKFNALNQKDFYWEYQFKRDWSKAKPQGENVTFKEKCVAAFKQTHRKKSKAPLTREQRDNLGGPTYFLYDEAVRSFRSLPQFLLFPAKLLTFVLNTVFGICLKSANFPFHLPIRSSRFVDSYRRGLRSFRGENYFRSKDFKNLHCGLENWAIFFILTYICDVGFIVSYIFCFFIRITSAGETKIMDIREGQRYNIEITFRRNQGEGQPVEYQNRFLRFPLYIFQFVLFCVICVVILAGFGIFPYLLIHYLSWRWYQGVLGPGFMLLVHYIAMCNIIYTTWRYAKKAAIYYRPYRVFTEFFSFISFLIVGSWNNVGKPLYDKLANILTKICEATGKCLEKCVESCCEALERCITAIAKKLWAGLKLVWKAIKFVAVKIIFSGYVGILAYVTKATFKCELMGDWILTPFALVWMLWPLIIPIFIEDKIYFVPAGIISLILVFLGYRTIHRVTKKQRQSNQTQTAQ